MSEVTQLLVKLKKDVEAAYAILAGSKLDNILERILLLKMNAIPLKLKEKLFKGYGPLSTFSAKIDLTYALGLIPVSVHKDLHIFKEVRNKFAHSGDHLNFESSEILKIVSRCEGYCKKDGGENNFLHRLGVCLHGLYEITDTMTAMKSASAKTPSAVLSPYTGTRRSRPAATGIS